MQKSDSFPSLGTDTIQRILETNTLPSPAEQMQNLLLWLGDNTNPGKWIDIGKDHRAIIGALDLTGVIFVADALSTRDPHLIECTSHSAGAAVQLNINGWMEYERLKREVTESRKAFMAMQYGDPDLDKVVEECFRPAVDATGFSLRRLDDEPRAGLIDDRLRVEIRTSRFLLADLTHDNRGAYWEAGFAEGLGKPVIYTCRKQVFEDEKTRPHFDTSHMLTVLWEPDNLNEAGEILKATIRATLPAEAKMTDD